MSLNEKKFIGAIYLHDGKAVSGFDKKTVLSDDPVSFADRLSVSDLDEIIVFDMSYDDASHERALDIIKDICKASDLPVIGAGNVKRMEDIKKLLYAGCKKACLNFSKQGNIDIIQEVSEKFGKDKIIVCCDNTKVLKDNKSLLEKFACGAVFITDDTAKIEGCESFLPIIINLTVGSDINFADYFGKYKDLVEGITINNDNISLDKISGFKADCIKAGIEICRLIPKFNWSDLKKNSDGHVPVIVQDYRTDQVLMLAYMNEEAYNKTLECGKMTYFSRSRNSLWLKGESSSHFQFVKALYADCDMDTILAKVRQVGPACHTGSYSCFFNEIASKEYSEKNPQKVLDSVFDVIKDRKVNPRTGSYTNYLFEKGLDKILKKVGEEATEMVIAAKNENGNEVVYEMSDFLYHMMVLMAEKNVSWEDITDELSRR